MKKFISIITCVILAFSVTSCRKFLDVNTDPNNPTSTTPNFLLPSIISNGFQIQAFESYQFVGLLTQNIGRRGAPNGAFEQYYFAPNIRPFQETYQIVGSNIPPMIKTAEAEGSVYYVGAGKIMFALILAHATDLVGDIPYTEAFNAALTIAPKYDTQESIYAVVDKLLDEGIIEMQKPASANFRPFYASSPSESGDILYKGDVNKWIKLAYSLKARQANHLVKKAIYDPTKILTYIDKAMVANTDDAQLYWQNPTSTVLSSNNVFGPTRGNFAAITFGRYFIEMLNGKNVGGDAALPDDPRLPIMAVSAAATGTMPGANNAQTALVTPAPSLSDFYGSWYAVDAYNGTTGAGVFPVITNSEMRFIEAEAAFRANLPQRAYDAYRLGITAHMDRLGVSVANRTTYLASTGIAQNPAGLSLKKIMEQKYIALYMNPETWADMRRLDYSQSIYTGFYYPTNPNPVAVAAGNAYPRRTYYPTTEVTLNPNEVTKQGQNAQNYFLKPLWWDQP
ncbi:SusD/RagB family nutrient-binding outer membrane lipoprotein [Mucilaginibacter myungsuensis]|uniref:SusD/RagB family nutrient-binding outer membrane lipoprotein n=1 Tax=Mucilaginibacter myungsuensis TaxID=649104 RepID=A0A929KX79_9SPHI|nr:SusD/RagB family nutrient-binding outer membrane lipoprotein [Mucilaginibacter myungsuensis]MBE9662847.1 SusD/RagB family nutrient-binding outer membrane lipoprotein [Mucilaginibacter myungsuensis]MDN3598267.1 SusD/RagB family nutrient-binding outer membrane lipoprotein [Mucilaginibacter myungsuensis]